MDSAFEEGASAGAGRIGAPPVRGLALYRVDGDEADLTQHARANLLANGA